MRLHKVLAVALLGCVACASTGGVQAIRLCSLSFQHATKRLANGMRVVVEPNRGEPTVLVTLRYGSGSSMDPTGREGLAHLVEHLAFRLDDDERLDVAPTTTSADPSLQSNGAAGPSAARVHRYLEEANAWTNPDETLFWHETEPQHVREVLDRLAARMDDFSLRISDAVFAVEREVIQNERRSTEESAPLVRCRYDLLERFYPKGHPYGHSTIGTAASIDGITRADVSTFLHAHYQPANATLTIIGPVVPETMIAEVEQLFGVKAASAASAVRQEPWQPRYREELVVDPRLPTTLVSVAWPLGPRFSEEVLALQTYLTSLGNAFNVELSRRDLATAVTTDLDEGTLESRFIVTATLRAGAQPQDARDIILGTAARLESAFGNVELATAKIRLPADQLFSAQRRLDRAVAMGVFFEAFGEAMAFSRLFERYEALELARVRSLGRQLLTRGRAYVLIHSPAPLADSGPISAQVSVATARERPRARVELAPPKERYEFEEPLDAYAAWATAAAREHEAAFELTLSNGLRCTIRQEEGLPLMAVTLFLRGGTQAEPAELRGLDAVLARTLDLASPRLREQRQLLSIRADYRADEEGLVLEHLLPSYHANEGLALIAETLSSPGVADAAIAQETALLAQQVAYEQRSPRALAWRAFLRTSGSEALLPMPTARTVAAITPAAVAQQQASVLQPARASLAVVSNRPTAEIRALVEKHFGAWRPSGPPETIAAVAVPPKPEHARVVVVKSPRAEETMILVALPTPGWQRWEDLVTQKLLAEILASRARYVRESLGATYGVSAGVQLFRNAGLLAVTAQVDPAVAPRVAAELARLVTELRTTAPTDEELEPIRRRLIRDYASLGHTNADKAVALAMRIARQRPPSYDREVIEALAQLQARALGAALAAQLAAPPVVVIAGADVSDAELASVLPGAEVLNYEAGELVR